MIFVASDHGGWRLKGRLVRWLSGQGHAVVDLGPDRLDPSDDYPTWSARLATEVRHHPGSFGIAVCRSGIGMAIVANKFKGIRAAQAWTGPMAVKSRQDENANILSLAADYQTWPSVQTVVRTWLKTPYRPSRRFERRLREIARLEHGR